MEILDVLFDNPFMVLIIAAVFSVSSVFKKAAENQKKAPNRPMEKKGPVPKPKRPFEDMKEIFKEATRTYQEEQSPFPTKKVNHEYEEKKMYVEQPVERSEAPLDDTNKKVKTLEPAKQKNINMEINESKLIESVIWSEILGPPRAKRSYYKSRK